MIKNFKRTNFVNGKNLDITFNDTVTIISGINGIGKTRLINALHTCPELKGQKVYKMTMDDIIQRESNEAMYIDIQDLKFSKKRGEMLELLLNDLFRKTESNLTCKYNKEMCLFRNGDPVSLYNLSLGEKTLMSLTYTLSQRDYDIVLIDTIDQVLHVDIQSEILDLIISLQPHAQIIYTTHSPSVLIRGWQDCTVYLGDYLS